MTSGVLFGVAKPSHNPAWSRQEVVVTERKVALGVTQSIAACRAVDLASKLMQAGVAVHMVMTRSATKLVGPAEGWLAIVGFLASRKRHNVGDFYIGGRKVGPWVTALFYVAAYFSSVVIIGGGGFGYEYGMATLWIGAANVLFGYTLAWIVPGRRLREFTTRLKTMTVPAFLAGRFSAKGLGAFVLVLIRLLKGNMPEGDINAVAPCLPCMVQL